MVLGEFGKQKQDICINKKDSKAKINLVNLVLIWILTTRCIKYEMINFYDEKDMKKRISYKLHNFIVLFILLKYFI